MDAAVSEANAVAEKREREKLAKAAEESGAALASVKEEVALAERQHAAAIERLNAKEQEWEEARKSWRREKMQFEADLQESQEIAQKAKLDAGGS